MWPTHRPRRPGGVWESQRTAAEAQHQSLSSRVVLLRGSAALFALGRRRGGGLQGERPVYYNWRLLREGNTNRVGVALKANTTRSIDSLHIRTLGFPQS